MGERRRERREGVTWEKEEGVGGGGSEGEAEEPGERVEGITFKTRERRK